MFFRKLKKKIQIPFEEQLQKNIKYYKDVIPFFEFIWTGLMVFFVILQVGWTLWLAIMVLVFLAYVKLAMKMDLTRLELNEIKEKKQVGKK